MLKTKLSQEVWSYSVYSKTLKALEYAECPEDWQEEKENYIYKLTEAERWIEWLPSTKEYIIIDLYDEGVFCLNYEIEYEDGEDVVIIVNLKLNKEKIKKFIWFVADNNYLDIEEVDEEIIDEEIYRILEVITEAIKEWDKKYLRSL